MIDEPGHLSSNPCPARPSLVGFSAWWREPSAVAMVSEPENKTKKKYTFLEITGFLKFRGGGANQQFNQSVIGDILSPLEQTQLLSSPKLPRTTCLFN